MIGLVHSELARRGVSVSVSVSQSTHRVRWGRHLKRHRAGLATALYVGKHRAGTEKGVCRASVTTNVDVGRARDQSGRTKL